MTEPAVTVPPVVETPAAGAPPPAAATAAAGTPPLASADSQVDPNWFSPRLARERTKVLKDAGFDSIEEAKAASAAQKAAKDAEKQTATKLAERDAELAASNRERDRLANITKEHAARIMDVLTKDQQTAVTEMLQELGLKPDDPAAQLTAVKKLGPTWAAAATEAKKAAAAAAGSTPPGSAPPRDAPPPVAPGSPPDHRTVYQQTRQQNPFAAAAYGDKHPEVYEPKT